MPSKPSYASVVKGVVKEPGLLMQRSLRYGKGQVDAVPNVSCMFSGKLSVVGGQVRKGGSDMETDTVLKGSNVDTEVAAVDEDSSYVRGTLGNHAFVCLDGTDEVSVRLSGDCVILDNAQPTAEPQQCSSIRVENSVRGSFHQGNERFRYAGVQCMAISLVSLAKHIVDSVFSWQTKDLDDVVCLGDKLYTKLRLNNMISGGATMLCVPDLPKQEVIAGRNFQFEYGNDYLCGDLNAADEELIQLGVHTSLLKALENTLAKYDTCLLTLVGNTCNHLSEWNVCSV